MKKIVSIVLVVLVVIVIAGFGGKKLMDNIFPQANGMIVYGEKEQVKDVLDKQAKQLKASDVYTIKISEADGQKVMYVSQATIDGLIQKKLLTKVKEDGSTEAVVSLPPVSKGEGLLFAKKESDKINGNSGALAVKYEGNIIIGDGRAYADEFVVLENAHWSSLQETEKTMAVLKFNKNPEKLMGTFEVETQQLVSIK
jgi:uncharacterized protein YxeA